MLSIHSPKYCSASGKNAMHLFNCWMNTLLNLTRIFLSKKNKTLQAQNYQTPFAKMEIEKDLLTA